MGDVMRKEYGSVKKLYPQIQAMHEQGMKAQEIGAALNLSTQAIYNVISNLGLSKPRGIFNEAPLIYADNKPPVLEKVTLYGKWEVKDGIRCRKNRICTDITPLFSWR